MKITLDCSDFKRTAKRLGVASGKVNSEIKKGMHEVAYHMRTSVANYTLPHNLHLRNRFTQAMFQYDKLPDGFRIGFNRKAWYMRPLDDKDSRTPLKAKFFAVPTSVARGGSNLMLPKGLMTLDYIKASIAAKTNRVFVIMHKNKQRGGIFKRTGSGKSDIVLLYNLVPVVTYHKPGTYFPFKKTILQTAAKVGFKRIMQQRAQGLIK